MPTPADFPPVQPIWGAWSFSRRLALAALVLAMLFAPILALDLVQNQRAFERDLAERSALLRQGVRTTVELKREEALHAAAFVASDAQVRHLMRLAHATSLSAERIGSEMAQVRLASLRAQLLANITTARSQAWVQELPDWQLEFHLAPGAFNFLRIADPARFGDDLSSVRPMVALTHEFRIAHSGFEVG